MKPAFPYKIVKFNELNLRGIFFLLTIFLLISNKGAGQCVNPPTLTLYRTTGVTCGITPVTVSGNTFAGGAVLVTINENGDGSVSPATINTSPFTFTYTPKSKDIGKTVIVTITTNNPVGSCPSAVAVYTLTVNAIPSAPHIGTITMPTCIVPTGSVALSGLPSGGTWTLTRIPGSVTTTGTGTGTTISGIPEGAYNFTVTSLAGCSSSSSSGVVINAQQTSLSTPAQTVDCTQGSGKAVVNVISPTGTGLQYRLDGGAFQSGTSFTSIPNGSHSVTVRNSSGCTTLGAIFEVSCGCANQPSVRLSSISGNTCGITPVTISGNTFGGSATAVTISENGAGTVSPVTTGTSAFEFTYTPSAGDAGNIVTIIVTTNNPQGSPCMSATANYLLQVDANPSAPVVGSITQPTCSVPTGNVVLSGLPVTGTWRITRNPGGIITTGTGISTTISSLPTGTNTFTVTNANNCISGSSTNVVLIAPSSAPVVPVVGSITLPTCIVPTGSVLLSGLPSTGNWTLTRYPGTVTSDGTGISKTISGLAVGIYNYTVTNSTGCVSGLSANVIIPQLTGIPTAPLVGTITQPITGLQTGSVVLSGLPEIGSWTLIMSPGNIATSGTGINKTISALAAGTYSFTVTSAAGCISGSSANVVITAPPGSILFVITNPAPVCFPTTVDITAPEVTYGSASDLTYTYWADDAAKIPYYTPMTATAGIYYIKGTTPAGLYAVKPVIVTLYRRPLAKAGADQVVEYQFVTNMNTELGHDYESGVWSVISGTGSFFNASYTRTSVEKLSIGENKFLWTVTNGVCPVSLDTVVITVHDLIISSLITPNMDGRNDYFVLKGSTIPGRTELVIFDRRGVQVYKNENYDNSWDGVDYKGKPLPDDTYFCIVKTGTHKIVSGYIVVRR